MSVLSQPRARSVIEAQSNNQSCCFAACRCVDGPTATADAQHVQFEGARVSRPRKAFQGPGFSLMKLSVIGTGYLGAVHAACMAHLGHEVCAYDADASKIAMLSA